MLIQSQHLSLHSTMSLLNQILFLLSSHSRPPLHSTMSLLNRCCSARKSATGKNFTFHNVSIKSFDDDVVATLLNVFTFHNVSIKSQEFYEKYVGDLNFTFHNVSIKSCTP